MWVTKLIEQPLLTESEPRWEKFLRRGCLVVAISPLYWVVALFGKAIYFSSREGHWPRSWGPDDPKFIDETILDSMFNAILFNHGHSDLIWLVLFAIAFSLAVGFCWVRRSKPWARLLLYSCGAVAIFLSVFLCDPFMLVSWWLD